MKRELLHLVLAVVLVDVVFIGGYFLFRLHAAGDTAKLVFTVAWTGLTLLVVLRALRRIRNLRGQRHP